MKKKYRKRLYKKNNIISFYKSFQKLKKIKLPKTPKSFLHFFAKNQIFDFSEAPLRFFSNLAHLRFSRNTSVKK
jgi:hypothetical protein